MFKKLFRRENKTENNSFVNEYKCYCIKKIKEDPFVDLETKKHRIAIIEHDFKMVTNKRMLASDFIKKNTFRFI